MKRIKTVTLWILGIFAVLNVAIVLSGNLYLYKAIYYNFTNIDDYKIFENRVIKASPTPQAWQLSKYYNSKNLSQELRQTLEELESIAFMIIKEDSILYEEYWDDYGTESYSNSFSMAKSWVSAAIGVALKEGMIQDLMQPISAYVPEFKGKPFGSTPILHILMMSSGSDWNESYINPFSVTTESYYGDDIESLMLNLEKEEPSGITWKYKSGDTQLLALILERASGMKLGDFIEKYLWHPMGAEQDALWSLDKEGGTEKAYCCLNSNARDFARLGKLYLHNGSWNGEQLIDESYVKNSTLPILLKHKSGRQVDWYGWQWWILPDIEGRFVYYARGILGQYVFVVPEEKMIIIRLGKKRKKRPEGSFHPEEVPFYVAETLKIFSND